VIFDPRAKLTSRLSRQYVQTIFGPLSKPYTGMAGLCAAQAAGNKKLNMDSLYYLSRLYHYQKSHKGITMLVAKTKTQTNRIHDNDFIVRMKPATFSFHFH